MNGHLGTKVDKEIFLALYVFLTYAQRDINKNIDRKSTNLLNILTSTYGYFTMKN